MNHAASSSSASRSSFSRFLLLFAGELISSIGSGLTSFGLGVYIFQKTGSAANMALVTLTGFLPTLLLSLPAGTLADRHDRRLLMMIGDGFSALGILYILLCMMQEEPALWQICLGVFVSAFFSALLEPAFRATITDLLTPDEYSKAAGLLSLAQSARFLISPVLAGALLAVTDIKVLLAIDVCTFFPTVFAAA
ncbi:MFS transporter, partial [Faecalibaculum rodentium]